MIDAQQSPRLFSRLYGLLDHNSTQLVMVLPVCTLFTHFVVYFTDFSSKNVLLEWRSMVTEFLKCWSMSMTIPVPTVWCL
jgi:hypothetical protein